jgi:hypothetical protein
MHVVTYYTQLGVRATRATSMDVCIRAVITPISYFEDSVFAI